MRVRRTTADGDICFGHNANDYLVNTPEAVAQNVRTRLALWQGQWFIDTDEGMPYLQQILGKQSAADLVIKSRILETPGVQQIDEFEAVLDPNTRRLTIQVKLTTDYGPASINGEIT